MEVLDTLKKTNIKIESLTDEIIELKEQNSIQQSDIENSIEFSRSHFRMSLFSHITKALERGYTSVTESNEIARMFTIYKKHGGNGEIELLYGRFDRLSIKEEHDETK